MSRRLLLMCLPGLVALTVGYLMPMEVLRMAGAWACLSVVLSAPASIAATCIHRTLRQQVLLSSAAVAIRVAGLAAALIACDTARERSQTVVILASCLFATVIIESFHWTRMGAVSPTIARLPEVTHG